MEFWKLNTHVLTQNKESLVRVLQLVTVENPIWLNFTFTKCIIFKASSISYKYPKS